MNETLRNYCAAEKIELTRCRPYRKNDQAHVEQKNGEIVRRMVGCHRYEGLWALSRRSATHGATAPEDLAQGDSTCIRVRSDRPERPPPDSAGR
jgi:hypothetical protein